MKKLVLGLIVLVAALLVVGTLLPTDYALSRSVVINADAAKIHPWVADLKKWDEWAPWKEMDPSIQVTYGPRTEGLLASQSWTGEDGGGELTIVESDPSKGIRFDLIFIQGDVKSPTKSAILYRPAAEGTEVSWSLEGDTEKMGLLAGWYAKLMDRFVGPPYERGLANLKQRVEGA